MNATKEPRPTRRFRQAIRRARKAWGALHRAEIALLEAWEACTDSERQAVCGDECLPMPASKDGAYELFRDLGA
jgi:hypothetical protein